MKTAVNYNGVDLEVTGEYRQGYEGKMYMRNGDPGYPGEEAEIENIDILHCGESIVDILSDSIIEEIETLAIKKIEDV